MPTFISCTICLGGPGLLNDRIPIATQMYVCVCVMFLILTCFNIDSHIVSYILFIAGKMFNDIQGTVNTNMNAEIFPTVVRGQALFFVAIIANIAGAISPFFMMLVSKMHY